MTDVLVHARLSQIIEAMDKMHNGLLAMIEAHQELKQEVDERLDNMRDDIENLTSQLRSMPDE
jgi:predicted translin family RNA/ssDNA-binding protein